MKKTLPQLQKMKLDKTPISWVTAYSYPLAYAAEQAGIDMILVGDSGGMVELGYSSTNPVTMDEMISFAKAARRGAPDTFLIGDMPQGSYEASDEAAVNNAMRFIKEAGCDAIKLEGGERMWEPITAIIQAGIVIIGHLGLTPQSAASFGGYKVQGKTPEGFTELMKDAQALEECGCSMLLLEAVPEQPAGKIAERLKIPVMGIGAGGQVDGQLLIMHDLLGLYPNFRPKFAKCYAPLAMKTCAEIHPVVVTQYTDAQAFGMATRKDGLLAAAVTAIQMFRREVETRTFPSPEYTYQLKESELAELQKCPAWD